MWRAAWIFTLNLWGGFSNDIRGLERKHLEILSALEKTNVEQFVEAQGLRERASYGASTNFEARLAEIAKTDSIEFVNKVKEILAK